MRIVDFLRDNRAIVKRFQSNGISPQYIHFLPLYDDWERLMAEGCKKQYAENVLAEKYNYTPRYIRILVRFLEDPLI